MRRDLEREREDPGGAEKALVRSLLAGDEAAFEQFADEYLPALYRFAQRRLRDHEISEEVVQATAVKAISKLSGFRSEAALMTWLCAICRNEIAGYFRRRGREGTAVELDEQGVAAGAPIGSAPPDDPETRLLGLERSELVHEALDALPFHYGRALEWKYLERLPVREIAERLGMGPKAAESMLTRARSAFRELYSRLAEMPGGLSGPVAVAGGAGRREG